jgi:hypothetical protein
MKTFLPLSILFFAFANSGIAQITITEADMPQAGDTVRVSMSADSTGLPTPALTGPGLTWNYSALVPASQVIDTFLAVSPTDASIPLAYLFYFDNPGEPAYEATVAQAGANLPSLGGIITISDVVNFYKDESNNYETVGYGATVNSIPAPVKDDTIDVVYNFPMNYGNADSCHSSNSLSIPSFGAYEQNQYRVNYIDGWGTLITPYGTFSTLKVKTLLYTSDSVYLDTLHFGFRASQPEQIQYKWLANGHPMPMLQINETKGSNARQYIYPDSARKGLLAGVAEINSSLNSVSLYPNPAKGNTTLSYNLSSTSPVTISVYSVDGRCVSKVFSGEQTIGNHTLNMSIDNLTAGIYLLKIDANGEQTVKKLVVVK